MAPGDYVMNDPGGNDERLAFVYRKAKGHPRNDFGEVMLHPRECLTRSVTVTYRKGGVEKTEKHPKATFVPFDR